MASGTFFLKAIMARCISKAVSQLWQKRFVLWWNGQSTLAKSRLAGYGSELCLKFGQELYIFWITYAEGWIYYFQVGCAQLKMEIHTLSYNTLERRRMFALPFSFFRLSQEGSTLKWNNSPLVAIQGWKQEVTRDSCYPLQKNLESPGAVP